MHRRAHRIPGHVLVAAIVLGAGVLGCGSTETSTTSTGSTPGTPVGAASASSPFCAEAVMQFSPTSPAADTKREGEAMKADALRLQSLAPSAIAADVATWVEASSADPKVRPPQADLDRWLAAANRLVDHIAATCPEGGPYWACLGQREEIKSLATAIDDEGPPPSEAVVDGATPEEVADKSRAVPGAKRTELPRSDTSVTFAWVDERGRLVQRVTVTKQDARWVAGRVRYCPT